MKKPTSTNPPVILRRKNLEQTLSISRSTIYARLDPNSKQFDPDFPKPFNLIHGSNAGGIGWLNSEVIEYVNRLAASRIQVM